MKKVTTKTTNDTIKDKTSKTKNSNKNKTNPKSKASSSKEEHGKTSSNQKIKVKNETTKNLSSKKETPIKKNDTKSKSIKNLDNNKSVKKQKNIIKETDVNEKSKTIEATTNIEDYDLNHVELDFENEVYDDADIASALELGFIAQALEAHKQKVAKETHPDFDGETCLDCGDDIPAERLNMGKIRCVYCQAALERKNKLLGK